MALILGPGQFVNHADGDLVNKKLEWSPLSNKARCRATKAIQVEEEILVDYGPDFTFPETSLCFRPRSVCGISSVAFVSGNV